MPAGPDEPPALANRAWAAYLRQELTAPAAALAEYARELAAHAQEADHAETATAAVRIQNRAEHLAREVQKLTADAGADSPNHGPDYWRQVRHDLRGAASFVVMACEDILEGAPPAVGRAIRESAERTLGAARKAINLVEAVVRFG